MPTRSQSTSVHGPRSSFLLRAALLLWLVVDLALALPPPQVTLEEVSPGSGPAVEREYRYRAHVTLYLDDGHKTPAGWSTRQSEGAAADRPYTFQPGVNLIQGWTEGVLQMVEGQRALLHVPAAKGYGDKAMGRPGGAGFYIPANSDLLFDIEILGKEEEEEL